MGGITLRLNKTYIAICISLCRLEKDCFLKGGKQGYHDVRTEGRGGIRGRKGGQRCLICSECSANEGASTVGAMGGCANGDVEGGCLIGDQRTDGKNFRRLRGWEPVVGRVAQPL